jgi:hypothetical protein
MSEILEATPLTPDVTAEKIQTFAITPSSLPASALKISPDVIESERMVLQELQEPAQCPACWQPISKVYCTPVPDVEVRLQLRAAGRSEYAGPCHRVNVPLS